MIVNTNPLLSVFYVKSEPNAKFVAFYDLVKFKSDFLNKNFTTLLASFEVRSAQTLSFEV